MMDWKSIILYRRSCTSLNKAGATLFSTKPLKDFKWLHGTYSVGTFSWRGETFIQVVETGHSAMETGYLLGQIQARDGETFSSTLFIYQSPHSRDWRLSSNSPTLCCIFNVSSSTDSCFSVHKNAKACPLLNRIFFSLFLLGESLCQPFLIPIPLQTVLQLLLFMLETTFKMVIKYLVTVKNKMYF